MIDSLKVNMFDALKMTWPVMVAVLSLSFWLGSTISRINTRFDFVQQQLVDLEDEVKEVRAALR